MVNYCVHCTLLETLMLMQILPTSTISPENRVYFAVFEFLKDLKMNAFVSNHGFRKAMNSYNLTLSSYSPLVSILFPSEYLLFCNQHFNF